MANEKYKIVYLNNRYVICEWRTSQWIPLFRECQEFELKTSSSRLSVVREQCENIKRTEILGEIRLLRFRQENEIIQKTRIL